MKTLLLSAALAALALGAAPIAASEHSAGSRIAGAQAFDGDFLGPDHFDRRGRGRGRGGDSHDDRRDDARDSRDRDGHGGRPRIPGGSGCDDPHDIVEHPECRR